MYKHPKHTLDKTALDKMLYRENMSIRNKEQDQINSKLSKCWREKEDTLIL